MNKPKVAAEEYIQFLVASPAAVSGTEAARVNAGPLVAHDAYTRLLHHLEPDAATLWQQAQGLVTPTTGVLVLDDTTLDKPYARHMGLVTRHWSGKHHAVVQEINLLTLLWSDGQALVLVNYRLYDKGTDELSKNDHSQHLLRAAQQRGFAPRCVLFDSWYASLANLKQVRACGWPWLTRLKRNRRVNPDEQGLRPLQDCALATDGQRVWLQGYGFVRVFRFAAPDGGTEGAEYWAASDPELTEDARRGGPGLGHRAVPPGPEAGLWRRESAGAGRPRPVQPHRLCLARLFAPRNPAPAHGPQLVRSQKIALARRDSNLFG